MIAFVALLLMPHRVETAAPSDYDSAVDRGAVAARQETTGTIG